MLILNSLRICKKRAFLFHCICFVFQFCVVGSPLIKQLFSLVPNQCGGLSNNYNKLSLPDGLYSCVVQSQVAQAPLGTVNMTLRNSVIIRVCMGI